MCVPLKNLSARNDLSAHRNAQNDRSKSRIFNHEQFKTSHIQQSFKKPCYYFLRVQMTYSSKLVFLFCFLPDIIIKWKRVEISIRKVFEIFLQGNRGFSYRSNSFHVPLICSGRDPQLWELRTTSILKNEKGDFSLTRKKWFLGRSLFTHMLQNLLSLYQWSAKGLSEGLNSQIFRIRNPEERQNLDMVQLSNDNFKRVLYKNSTQNWSCVRKWTYYKGNRRSEFSFIKVFFCRELLSHRSRWS